MTGKTPSQRAAMSRRKGVKFERDVAQAIKPWFPEAKRSRDNGHRNAYSASPDSGDLAGIGPDLFASLKNDENGSTDAEWSLGRWFDECQEKARSLNRMGVLIQKRAGYADPLDSWCWLSMPDLISTATCQLFAVGSPATLPVRVRLSLRDALDVFAAAEITLAQPSAVAS